MVNHTMVVICLTINDNPVNCCLNINLIVQVGLYIFLVLVKVMMSTGEFMTPSVNLTLIIV